MKLVWSKLADRDLIEIWQAIAPDSEKAADDILDRLQARAEALVELPKMGPLRMARRRLSGSWSRANTSFCTGSAAKRLKSSASCMAAAISVSSSPLFDTLWSSQQGLCAICREPMPKGRFDTPHATVWKKKRPTFDHIRPRKKGGDDAPENLQLAHAECNWTKSDSWKPNR